MKTITINITDEFTESPSSLNEKRMFAYAYDMGSRPLGHLKRRMTRKEAIDQLRTEKEKMGSPADEGEKSSIEAYFKKRLDELLQKELTTFTSFRDILIAAKATYPEDSIRFIAGGDTTPKSFYRLCDDEIVELLLEYGQKETVYGIEKYRKEKIPEVPGWIREKENARRKVMDMSISEFTTAIASGRLSEMEADLVLRDVHNWPAGWKQEIKGLETQC